jgi:transposase
MQRKRFQAGQVWRRRDGQRYRLVARAAGGWQVQIGPGQKSWSFTDRHLHNLVCSERLRLESTAAAVVEQMRAAGLDRLARRVCALLPDARQDAFDAEQMLEEKLEDETDPRYADQLRQGLDKVQDTLQEKVRMDQTNRIAPPNFTNRDSVRQPHRITR